MIGDLEKQLWEFIKLCCHLDEKQLQEAPKAHSNILNKCYNFKGVIPLLEMS